MAFISEVADLIQTIQTTGEYQGKAAKAYYIMGRRAGFTSTSALNDIREFEASGVGSTALNPVLSNSTLDLNSANAADTAAGIGAQSVKIVYINNLGALIESADIPLTGGLIVAALTNVNEVLWMEVTAVGSNTVAVGNIILSVTGGGAAVEQISAGSNRSLSARVMIPTGWTGYIAQWDGSAISSNQDIRLRATVNSFDSTISSVYHFIGTMYLSAGVATVVTLPFTKLPENSRCKASTISSATASNNRVDISFILILIEN